MIALFDALESQLDLSDPAHAEARRNIERWRELHAQAARLKAEFNRLLNAGKLARARQKLTDHEAVTIEMKALAERAVRLTAGVQQGTEAIQ